MCLTDRNLLCDKNKSEDIKPLLKTWNLCGQWNDEEKRGCNQTKLISYPGDLYLLCTFSCVLIANDLPQNASIISTHRRHQFNSNGRDLYDNWWGQICLLTPWDLNVFPQTTTKKGPTLIDKLLKCFLKSWLRLRCLGINRLSLWMQIIISEESKLPTVSVCIFVM